MCICACIVLKYGSIRRNLLRCVFCRKITVVYNMKEAMLPMINSKIRYYSIPHCFCFELYHGVCAMQYSLFSTNCNLLPQRPDVIPGK